MKGRHPEECSEEGYLFSDWPSFHDISARGGFPETNAPSWYLSAIHSVDAVSA